jgi:hypothetical protein
MAGMHIRTPIVPTLKPRKGGRSLKRSGQPARHPHKKESEVVRRRMKDHSHKRRKRKR